jgi:trehalose 6-phosphate synthase/phosphatase
MPADEQKTRITALQKRLSRYNVDKWAQDFMKALQDNSQTSILPSPCKKISKTIREAILTEYSNAESKLILLDYDGTLVDFCNNPDEACPSKELYDLLDEINNDPNTHVAIISGRGRESIERWFGDKNYTLITDHGVWMRRAGELWEKLEDPKTEWKEIIRPVMESFIDRTPGAFIEEKQYSLAWHYRKADPEMSEIRTRELKNLLTALVADNGLSVLDGNKVLEVKNNTVDKGRAAARLISTSPAEYIFAAGDDHTDEFMFAELPESAHTIKVGTAETGARYYLADTKELKKLLNEFADISVSQSLRGK